MTTTARVYRTLMRLLHSSVPRVDLAHLRFAQEASGWLITPGGRVACRSFSLRGLPLARLEPAPSDLPPDVCMLHLHGGGFVGGSMRYAKTMAKYLAASLGIRTLTVGYRLAPEHPYPAALQDAVAAYRYLLQRGYKKIILVGESAGGGLIVSLAVRLRELDLPMPAGLYALSPWADLACSGDSYGTIKDPSLRREPMLKFGALYANGLPLDDPRISPVYADLTGLPPALIQVGEQEFLHSDAVLLGQSMKRQGVTCRVECYKDMWHVFQAFAMPEARFAMARAKLFCRDLLS